MMMNGANCYGQDYTYLLRRLASKGYLTVAPTQFHPALPKQEGKDFFKGADCCCDCQSVTLPTAHMARNKVFSMHFIAVSSKG